MVFIFKKNVRFFLRPEVRHFSDTCCELGNNNTGRYEATSINFIKYLLLNLLGGGWWVMG